MESNSLDPTELFVEKEERNIPEHCSMLMKRSSVPVSSQGQYDELQDLREVCHGDVYSLEQNVIHLEKRLAEEKAKLAYINNVNIESKKKILRFAGRLAIQIWLPYGCSVGKRVKQNEMESLN